MSITQNVEFPASTGATLTANAFVLGSDNVALAAATVTEATNRKGVYVAAFTSTNGLAAGTYLIDAQDAGSNPFYVGVVALLQQNGTFQVEDLAIPAGGGGGGSDPLLNPVPGSYPQGSAGFVLGGLAGAPALVINPVGTNGTITLIRGRDYKFADGRALAIVNAAGSWPNLTAAQSITLYVKSLQSQSVVASITGSSPVPTGANQSVRFDVPAAATAGLIAAGNLYPYLYEIVAVLADGNIVSLQEGNLILLANASS